MAATGKLNIGWIGTGVMGRWMCQHLMKAGHSATVYNRTAAKCAPLVELGATLAETPRQVAECSDIVFTIVGYPKDVREVVLGENGVLAGLAEGGLVCDMTTSEPSLAVEIAAAAAAKGCAAVDAPVSGGDVGAREARLSIMCGGDKAAIERLQPLFELMGKNIKHMGGPGAGQHTKMCNQILIATNMIGVCEGLLYAQKAGLDLNETIAAVGAGAAGSWSINNLGPRIAKGDFEPGFFVEHFIKDLGIALAESERMGLNLPGLKMATDLYKELAEQGHARSGTQALMLALERINGIERGEPAAAAGAEDA